MSLLIRILVIALSHLPFRVLYALADVLYYPLYYVIRYRRRIVRHNLTTSFPDKSLHEILEIERRFYHYFADMMLETCKLASISPAELRRRVRFVNPKLITDALAEGQSVATYLGHYCNWEWMSSISLWLREDDVCGQVYHRLRSEAMDTLMRQLRERCGSTCVEMRQTARFVASMQSQHRPCLLALIADHSPKRRDIKHYTRFLHHNAPVLIGPEKLIKHFGYKPLFATPRRVARGYYEVEFTLLHPDPTSLPDYQLSDLYFERLEEEINVHPEYYLWTHNRFKYALEEGTSSTPSKSR